MKYFNANSSKIGIIFIFIIYLPYLIYQEHSFIGNPFDYLDTNIVWMKVLIDNGAAFWENCRSLPNIMHQSRISYGSELDFIFLLFILFGSFWAVVINSFLITLIAYISFFSFIKYIRKDYPNYLLAFISLCFALLPFWQFGGISIAGLPLIFLIFFKIWNKEKLKIYHYIFWGVYLFYSSLIVYTVYVYLFLFIFFTAKQIIAKKINYKLILIFFVSIIISLAREYRQILFVLNPCYESNRNVSTFNIEDIHITIGNLFNQIINSNQHADPVNLTILIFFLLSLPLVYKKFKRFFIFLILYILVSEVLSMGIGGLIFTHILSALHLNSLSGFSFHRFNVVNQFLWYLVFAILIYDISKMKKIYGKIISLFFITFTFLNIARSNNIIENIRGLFNQDRFRYHIRFSDYFMLEDFEKIQQILPQGKSKYSVIHYGMDPATSIYHGYTAFDGDLAFYNKNYNKTFDDLVAPLLKLNPNRYEYAYYNKYIVPENYKHTHNFLQSYSKKPQILAISFETAKQNNIKYLFSTVPFTNKEIKLLANIKSQYWEHIYIYRLL